LQEKEFGVPDKKAASSKGNFFQRLWANLRQLLRETIGELRKVSWPTRREALYLTGVVLVVIITFGTILWVLDLIYLQFFKVILG
jgi:preprotein translocase subunit SecE